MIKLEYPKFWSNVNLIAILLIPLSWIYQIIGIIRKFITKPIKFDAITICVGNATVGGTGKTQIVLSLIRQFKEQNLNFIVVTKGYNSKLKQAKLVQKSDTALTVGDESILLSKYATVIAAKKVKYALNIIKDLKPDIIIFDDGLQNPSFIKDYNILAIDKHRSIGNNLIFPAGPLRENVKDSIKKSDMIVTIGNNHNSELNNLLNKLNNQTSREIFDAKIQLYLEKLEKEPRQKSYLAFAAIGNPKRFFDLLKESKINIAEEKIFPDHHIYSDAEINDLINYANKKGYKLVTTEKDYVKINRKEEILCIESHLIFKNHNKFFKLINEKIKAPI